VDLSNGSPRVAFEDRRRAKVASSFKEKVVHRFANLLLPDAATLDALDA